MNVLILIPVIVVGMLSIFILFYPDMLPYAHCDGDYCYICADREELEERMADLEAQGFEVSVRSMVTCDNPVQVMVRYDRP